MWGWRQYIMQKIEIIVVTTHAHNFIFDIFYIGGLQHSQSHKKIHKKYRWDFQFIKIDSLFRYQRNCFIVSRKKVYVYDLPV